MMSTPKKARMASLNASVVAVLRANYEDTTPPPTLAPTTLKPELEDTTPPPTLAPTTLKAELQDTTPPPTLPAAKLKPERELDTQKLNTLEVASTGTPTDTASQETIVFGTRAASKEEEVCTSDDVNMQAPSPLDMSRFLELLDASLPICEQLPEGSEKQLAHMRTMLSGSSTCATSCAFIIGGGASARINIEKAKQACRICVKTKARAGAPSTLR